MVQNLLFLVCCHMSNVEFEIGIVKLVITILYCHHLDNQ